MALLRTLAATCENLPSLALSTVGVGAGTRDTPHRPNVVRVLLGDSGGEEREAVVLEANVDDLDPRLWPGVISALLAAGADDAWLVPILMKKGRPANTLTVLCAPAVANTLRDRIFQETSTLGVRSSRRSKTPLPRTFVHVDVDGHPVAIKIGHTAGRIVQVMPEFEEVAALARVLGITQREALARATRAAADAGLVIGASESTRRC